MKYGKKESGHKRKSPEGLAVLWEPMVFRWGFLVWDNMWFFYMMVRLEPGQQVSFYFNLSG